MVRQYRGNPKQFMRWFWTVGGWAMLPDNNSDHEPARLARHRGQPVAAMLPDNNSDHEPASGCAVEA